MTGFNTQLSAECISLLNLVMALSSSVQFKENVAVENDTEEKKLLNKLVIFAFLAHKEYSHSLIILGLNH